MLTEENYLEAIEQYGDEFEAKMGAEAIRELLMSIDIEAEVAGLREEIPNTNSETKLRKLNQAS